MMSNVSPFDLLAENYDTAFTTSGIGMLQRERVWDYLHKMTAIADKKLEILEINCGTGEDAIRLAALGHTVTATDASAAMISKAMLKQNASIDFRQCAFAELVQQFSGRQFDLVLSDFGGLNCINAAAMQSLGNDLRQLLRPGGKLFVVLMSDRCIWEWMYFLSKGKPGKAIRRFRNPAVFDVDGITLPVYYYSPGKLRQVFKSGYVHNATYPVGLFIPPSYLQERYTAMPDRLQRLARREKKFSPSFLSRFADHFCACFTKAEHT